MTSRQAKKIVKRQVIRCRRRIDGPQDVTTAGDCEYGETTFRRALRIALRKLDRKIARAK